jgi:hypothetical protein
MVEEVRAIAARWQRYYDEVRRPSACLHCDSCHVVFNGWRKRSASVLVNDEAFHIDEVRCRRVRCQGCRVSWTLRPPGLCARKHYQLCVVARATSTYLHDRSATQSRVASAMSCSRRQVARWLLWVGALADPADLAVEVIDFADETVLAPVREVAATWRKGIPQLGLQFARRAASVLAHLEVVGLLAGTPSPGLRAVLEGLRPDGLAVTPYARPSVPELARRHPGGSPGRLSAWLKNARQHSPTSTPSASPCSATA